MVRPKENLTELYDLAADPGETIDLAADEPELVRDPLDVLGGRRLACGEPRRVGGQEEEEDIRDERHSEEEDAGPEGSSDEILEHVVSGWGGEAVPPLPLLCLT
jgi:hypothetical protein